MSCGGWKNYSLHGEGYQEGGSARALLLPVTNGAMVGQWFIMEKTTAETLSPSFVDYWGGLRVWPSKMDWAWSFSMSFFDHLSSNDKAQGQVLATAQIFQPIRKPWILSMVGIWILRVALDIMEGKIYNFSQDVSADIMRRAYNTPLCNLIMMILNLLHIIYISCT